MDISEANGLPGEEHFDTPPYFDGPGAQDAQDAILAVLRERTGHDFRNYKRGTVLRRLERRLRARGVPDLAAYRALLENDGVEPEALLRDLLIGVTAFFRDREAFHALERQVLPDLFTNIAPHQPLRAWVAACATGQEAYSLGMLLSDVAARRGRPPAFQIFASDIDARAIAIARTGRYPPSIASEIPHERLERHFVRDDGCLTVRKALRDRILFASHNLLHDPAFCRLNLVSCRNLLIYLERDVHLQVLQLFHAALLPGGYLFLGGSESAETVPHLFEPVDTWHRIYRARPAMDLPRRLSMERAGPLATLDAGDGVPHADTQTRQRLLSPAAIHWQQLARLASPSVLVDSAGAIIHASEHAGQFLRHAGGEISSDLPSLVRCELRPALDGALREARLSGIRADTVPICHEQGGASRLVRISVLPAQGEAGGKGFMLVRFDDLDGVACPRVPDAAELRDARFRELEAEVLHLRQAMRLGLEQQQAAGSRQLRANEELMCLVNDLRATIEKLETGREELQSRNEELRIVNAEQKVKVDETGKANDDLANLIASTDIATLFLDRDMRIKRFTPHVSRVFNVIPADIGRPLAHITNRLDFPDLFDRIGAVFATLDPVEREARGSDGRDYIVRIHPYRTADKEVDGVVVTFFDISCRRQAEQALRASEARYRADLEQQVHERTTELKQSRDLLQGTMDSSTDMIQVFRAIRDVHGVIIDFQWLLNNQTSEMKYGEVCGESLLQRNPGVVPTGIFDTFSQVTETGIPQQHERHYTHEQFDGWFLQSVVRLGDGVATTTKEITAWKVAQEEVLRLRDGMAQAKLRDIEAKYRGLIDLIPAAVYACNADGTLACCNGRAAALWGGMPAADDTAWPLRGAWRSHMPDGTPVEPSASPMAGVLATGDPVVNRPLRLERPDRSFIDVLVNITAVRDAAGNVTGAIGIYQEALSAGTGRHDGTVTPCPRNQ